MTIKVFYNTLPGQKIDGIRPQFNLWEEAPYTSFHHILNTIGIQYEWSDDPKDSLVVLDIGSTPYETEKEHVEPIDKLPELLGCSQNSVRTYSGRGDHGKL